MITNFPIIQNSSEPKKKFCTLRRDLVCSNKLDFICNKLKIAQKKTIKTQTSEELFQQLNNQYQQKLEKINQVSVESISASKCEILPDAIKRRHDGLNKNFNRTKIDWDHNFIGNKYLQKIKQQLKYTKYTNFHNNKEEQKTKSSPLLNSKEISMFREKNLISNQKAYKGLSQEQLVRIKMVKQKRRRKVISLNTKQTYLNHEDNTLLIPKAESETEKLTQISPWQDYPSRLSSIFMKGS